MTVTDALAAYVGPGVFNQLQWSLLTQAQRDAILDIFRSGVNAGAASGSVCEIEAVHARGRVVVCGDGSRWTVPATDAEAVEEWGEGQLIAIHRGMIYRLDSYEAVEAEPLRL